MGLKRFDNNLPTKKKKVKQIIVVLCICLAAVISVTSYAIFQVRHSKPIADAKVGKFKNSDIVLEILIDGEKSETFPEKDSNKAFSELVCTNGGIAEWDSETWELSIIDISGPTECTISFKTETPGTNAVEKLTELAESNTTEMFIDDTADANIRYMGSNPANYVDIGNGSYAEDLYRGYSSETSPNFREYPTLEACQTGIEPAYSGGSRFNTNCTKIHSKGDTILWRIIGVMNNVDDGTGKKETRIKLIRERKIGILAWDNKCTGTYDEEAGTCSTDSRNNNWQTASLNKTLNEAFYNSTKTTDPNSISYMTTSQKWTKLDYSSIGLASDNKNFIGDAVYHLGGPTTDNNKTLTTSGYYETERSNTVYSGNPTTWTGKVGLMYPSDYAYATSGGTTKSKEACAAKELYNWHESEYIECPKNNWLYTGLPLWTITPYASKDYDAMYIYDGGSLMFAYSFNDVGRSNYLLPVVYLRSDVKITGGEGTKENPYIIGL